MDRFIDATKSINKLSNTDLKSNMDRFIGYNSESVPKDFRI